MSSTTTLAILAGSELGLVSAADPTHLRPAVATLSALVGLALIIARLVRLGFVRHFVSAPVLTGRRGSGSINCRSCVFRGLDSAARVHRHPQSADHGISSAMAACLGVLTLGTPKGILVAILLSMISLAIQAAHPRVYLIGRKGGADVSRPLSAKHPDDETIEGLLRAPPEGRIFFLNSDSVLAQVEALIKEHRPRVLAFDMSRIPDIEYSALCMLDDLERRAQALGFEYWLVALNPRALSVVDNVGLAARLGRERMPFNARAARRRFEERHASEHPASTSIGS